MHEVDLILTLTGGLAAALICGYVTFRLGLSPIVGYLIAGFVVGPHTPGFVANKQLADELAEVGVILLMFGVGLQFHLMRGIRAIYGDATHRDTLEQAGLENAVALVLSSSSMYGTSEVIRMPGN